MQLVDSQVSPTLHISASGQVPSLGFSCKNAGHSTEKRSSLRRFKVGKTLGPAVLSLIAAELRPAVRELVASMVKDELSQQNTTRVFNHDDVLDQGEAGPAAFSIRCGINAARSALTAYSARGQLASWRKALPFLPSSYVDAVDYLDVYAENLVDSLRAETSAIAPTIALLNAEQPSARCWSRPVERDQNGKARERGCWTGGSSWFNHAEDILVDRLCGPGKSISKYNRHAILRAIVAFVDQNGRNLTASHQTIADLAISDYGCTLKPKTAEQRVRTIRRILKDAGFILVLAQGGRMTSVERLAAEVHHGGRQSRCGNTCDLNLPKHLRPTPPPAPEAPSYAKGLGKRLNERDCQIHRKSTYTVGSGFQSLSGTTWVAPARASAREHPENSQLKLQDATPSLRDWHIADDLTRRGAHSAAENGPYAHLVGPESSQMSLAQLAVVIATFIPADVDTKLLLRGLAHAATSHSTGFIALGLRTRPNNSRAWITTVLRRIDWNQSDSFPSWSTAAQAFGIHWCGDRHQWRPTSLQPIARAAPAGLPASAPQRALHLAQIRRVLT